MRILFFTVHRFSSYKQLLSYTSVDCRISSIRKKNMQLFVTFFFSFATRTANCRQCVCVCEDTESRRKFLPQGTGVRANSETPRQNFTSNTPNYIQRFLRKFQSTQQYSFKLDDGTIFKHTRAKAFSIKTARTALLQRRAFFITRI